MKSIPTVIAVMSLVASGHTAAQADTAPLGHPHARGLSGSRSASPSSHPATPVLTPRRMNSGSFVGSRNQSGDTAAVLPPAGAGGLAFPPTAVARRHADATCCESFRHPICMAATPNSAFGTTFQDAGESTCAAVAAAEDDWDGKADEHADLSLSAGPVGVGGEDERGTCRVNEMELSQFLSVDENAAATTVVPISSSAPTCRPLGGLVVSLSGRLDDTAGEAGPPALPHSACYAPSWCAVSLTAPAPYVDTRDLIVGDATSTTCEVTMTVTSLVAAAATPIGAAATAAKLAAVPQDAPLSCRRSTITFVDDDDESDKGEGKGGSPAPRSRVARSSRVDSGLSDDPLDTASTLYRGNGEGHATLRTVDTLDASLVETIEVQKSGATSEASDRGLWSAAPPAFDVSVPLDGSASSEPAVTATSGMRRVAEDRELDQEVVVVEDYTTEDKYEHSRFAVMSADRAAAACVVRATPDFADTDPLVPSAAAAKIQPPSHDSDAAVVPHIAADAGNSNCGATITTPEVKSAPEAAAMVKAPVDTEQDDEKSEATTVTSSCMRLSHGGMADAIHRAARVMSGGSGIIAEADHGLAVSSFGSERCTPRVHGPFHTHAGRSDGGSNRHHRHQYHEAEAANAAWGDEVAMATAARATIAAITHQGMAAPAVVSVSTVDNTVTVSHDLAATWAPRSSSSGGDASQNGNNGEWNGVVHGAGTAAARDRRPTLSVSASDALQRGLRSLDAAVASILAHFVEDY